MIPEIERKAVLALFPYFSKHPIMVDVGSNKGDWSAVLIENMTQSWLMEPNTILLHYSQVRFRHLRRVEYRQYAISDHRGTAQFIYFEDEHDGLSNIIGNKSWDYLKPKVTSVETHTLDWLSSVDLLKIDVEGAELRVLHGAENMLCERRVKFIEVEHAEHIEVTGYKFQDIIDYLAKFDYAPFHYDGDLFVPFTGQEAENVFFMDKNFSQDWNKEFIKNTKGMKFNFVLEIGCFEGLTSKYICENLLNAGGRIICVDPLTDEYLPGHKDNEMFVGQFDRFTRNTRGLPVELIRKRSDQVYDLLKDYRFDLIYADGDHTEEAVLSDGILAFSICKVGGYILFDDAYGYDDGTTRGVEKFLKMYADKIRVVSKGYQVMVEKTQN